MTDNDSVAKFVRLQNGDDLVSQVVEIEDDDGILYHLINPLKVVYVPTGTGHSQVAFMPWVFPKIVDDQDFIIHIEDVLLINDVTEYMSNYYWDNIETYQNNVADSIVENEVETVDEEYETVLEVIEELRSKRTFH